MAIPGPGGAQAWWHGSSRGVVPRRTGLRALPCCGLWDLQYLHTLLEIEFSRQFSVLLKLCWAILAITKVHRSLSLTRF